MWKSFFNKEIPTILLFYVEEFFIYFINIRIFNQLLRYRVKRNG
jgi:hypothetical protein